MGKKNKLVTQVRHRAEVKKSELRLDVYQNVDDCEDFGWEITRENGDLIDSGYGFQSAKEAESAGKKEIKKMAK